MGDWMRRAWEWVNSKLDFITHIRQRGGRWLWDYCHYRCCLLSVQAQKTGAENLRAESIEAARESPSEEIKSEMD